MTCQQYDPYDDSGDAEDSDAGRRDEPFWIRAYEAMGKAQGEPQVIPDERIGPPVNSDGDGPLSTVLGGDAQVIKLGKAFDVEYGKPRRNPKDHHGENSRWGGAHCTEGFLISRQRG